MRISDWSSDVCSSDLGLQGGVGLARDGALGDVHQRENLLAAAPGVAHRFQGVDGLAGLRDEEADAAVGHRRLAVAELRGDVDLDRLEGDLLEPVLRHHAGKSSEEHTSELQSLMHISYAVICLKNKRPQNKEQQPSQYSTSN